MYTQCKNDNIITKSIYEKKWQTESVVVKDEYIIDEDLKVLFFFNLETMINRI